MVIFPAVGVVHIIGFGGLKMPIDHLMQLKEKFDIQIFDEKQDISSLRTNHVCFSGSPRKHPDRDNKIILVSDLFGTHPTYYEFYLQDISFVERLSNSVTIDGETATTARIWVKKGSIGIHATPFVVEDINVSRIL